MKKDLLVVFTKDIDEYNLNKQLKNFTESEIVRINDRPNYETLYSMAKFGFENGFNSFHYLTESSDWAELDFEFKKEFSMFNEAGVIKGNYGKARLVEADNQNQTKKINDPLFVIFPANFAQFDRDGKIKSQFINAIKSQASYEPKYLLLPRPEGVFENKSAGLTADEAYELFNEVAKAGIGDIFKNKKVINLKDPNFLNGFGLTPESNPIYLGPDLWSGDFYNALRTIKQNANINDFKKGTDCNSFAEYNINENEISVRNTSFSNKLSEYINNLKAESTSEPLNENDKAILNNMPKTVVTDKQNYVNQCFNIAIYNITNNIDIQNNTQINVNIAQININNGLQIIGSVANTLLDVDGNLEATKGTIYNAGIKALQYGARRTFTNRDKTFQAGADAKAAFNKMTGNHFNIDDSYETDKLNKSNTLDSEVRNQSAAKAKAKQDARLSDLNINDTKKKIEILTDKLEQVNSEIKSAQDDIEKNNLTNSKKEIEQELMNAKAQLSAYTQHKTHNQNFGDIEQIKQQQHDRDNSASGLNGARNNPYSNMGNVDAKTKVQKAKNISQAQELNQKMEAKLLTPNPKTNQRPLDELALALS